MACRDGEQLLCNFEWTHPTTPLEIPLTFGGAPVVGAMVGGPVGGVVGWPDGRLLGRSDGVVVGVVVGIVVGGADGTYIPAHTESRQLVQSCSPSFHI